MNIRIGRRLGLGLVIVGAVVAMAVAVHRPDQTVVVPAVKLQTERPWLTLEAKNQLVTPEGTPGPLFSDVMLGGSPPSPEARARIAEFARANQVDIRLEVSDDELRAIRLSVTFAGCCGYEGADSLASRFHRPKRQSCIDCKGDWVDDWSIEAEHGHIDDVAFTLRDGDIDEVQTTMRAHWGRPHVAGSTWVWKNTTARSRRRSMTTRARSRFTRSEARRTS